MDSAQPLENSFIVELGLPDENWSSLYKLVARPILNYGTHIWHNLASFSSLVNALLPDGTIRSRIVKIWLKKKRIIENIPMNVASLSR